MKLRLRAHSRLLAFGIGGVSVAAELALLFFLGHAHTAGSGLLPPTPPSQRVELPRVENGAAILIRAMEANL